jgi:hypothetical protein
MADEQRYSLVKDPGLPWDGPFPYDDLTARLRDCGVVAGPSSSAAAINDSLYDLMAHGAASAEARAAWEVLRNLGSRLAVDFFLYEVDASEVETALEELAACDVPVVLPDFRELAGVPPDPAAVRVEDRIGTAVLPEAVFAARTIEEKPWDIGSVSFDVLRVMEEPDERR